METWISIYMRFGKSDYTLTYLRVILAENG